MSSAIDYLRQLQSQLQDNVTEISPELLKHRFEQVEGFESVYSSIADSVSTLEQQEKWLLDEIVTPFLSNIPTEDARQLVDVPVGLLPIYEPNAWAVQTPGGENLIALHTEIASVISFYSELQIAIWKIHSENQELAYELHEKGFEAIFQSFRQQRKLAFPIIPVKLTPQEFGVVQMKTFASELFILAHEFAHVALGHTGACVNAQLGMARKTHVRKFNWEQQQELDADLKAIEWLYHLKGKNISTLSQLATKFPIMCAEALVLIHFVESHVGFPDATSTHPPASERLKNIASNTKNLLSDAEMQELSQWIKTTEDVKSV
jgi:hypothetical protein